MSKGYYQMSSKTVDITPSPRILRMLGRIDFSEKQCLAELIDNPLDAIDESGVGSRIKVIPPSYNEFDEQGDNAELIIKDDGPGMSESELEKNLRAGFSGKDPVNKLGLFGMGFNIATARLGSRTKVRTTRKGDENWIVVTIDHDEMEADESYTREIETEQKADPDVHGTEVVITKLDERVRTLHLKTNVREGLDRIYSPILTQKGSNIEIVINGHTLSGRPHCVWSETRSVKVDGEEFPARISIDKKVGEEYYCRNCWSWWEPEYFSNEEETVPNCPDCEEYGNMELREQRVEGWVGIQRFFDEDHYGIDLIRNGRVIDKLNKDLFYWIDPETDERELEYPLDTLHWGGRIIGELHIDFVPVTYTKDAFEKSGPRWKRVRHAVRGEGPFRPTMADKHGYKKNRSPLGKLFKGYRKGNPPGKKRLVPGEIKPNGNVKGDNSKAKEWADRFWAGDPEYQNDTKWWEKVELVEDAKRSSTESNSGSTKTKTGPDEGGSSGNQTNEVDLGDLDPDRSQPDLPNSDDGDGNATNDENQNESEPELSESEKSENEEGSAEKPSRKTERDDDISGEYEVEDLNQPSITIEAYELVTGDLGESPVEVTVNDFSNIEVVFDSGHEVFAEFGYKPVDAVLMELAGLLRERIDMTDEWPQSRLYSYLKAKYCPEDRLSTTALSNLAGDLLREIKKTAGTLEFDVEDYDIPDETEESVRETVWKRLSAGEDKVSDLLTSSAYLQFAPHYELVRVLRERPDEFFDGNVFIRNYASLGSQRLKKETTEQFVSLLEDAVLLCESGSDYDLGSASATKRMEVQRAAYSLRILEAELET